MNLKVAVAGVALAGLLTVGVVACNDEPACAGPSNPRPAPRPAAPRVQQAPKPAYKQAPVNRPTTKSTKKKSKHFDFDDDCD